MKEKELKKAESRALKLSCGPTKKYPGWESDFQRALEEYSIYGRSMRSKYCQELFEEARRMHKKVLGIPDDYLTGFWPASNSGAFESAMWCLLGERVVEVCYWGHWGEVWYKIMLDVLELEYNVHNADYGKIADLSLVNPYNDIVLVWNETSSGVVVPDTKWVPKEDKQGLIFVDATSTLFAMEFPWDKGFDVITWSPQKCLGGQAAFGLIAISPAVIERIENYAPVWPVPRIMDLRRKDGKLNEGPFKGKPINTVSVEGLVDYILGLKWADKVGLDGLIRRSKTNYSVLKDWVEETEWIDFLVKDERIRSHTSVTLEIVDPRFNTVETATPVVNDIVKLLDKERMAYDVKSYGGAPIIGFRVWCGPTIDLSDIRHFTKCLEWAWQEVTKKM